MAGYGGWQHPPRGSSECLGASIAKCAGSIDLLCRPINWVMVGHRRWAPSASGTSVRDVRAQRLQSVHTGVIRGAETHIAASVLRRSAWLGQPLYMRNVTCSCEDSYIFSKVGIYMRPRTACSAQFLCIGRVRLLLASGDTHSMATVACWL